jgi:hypothetical protein
MVMSLTDMTTRAQHITLYTVDLVTGDVQEKCTSGMLSNGRGWAMWGRSDTTGQYAVGLDRAKKNFIVIDPEKSCDQAFALRPIKYPADLGPYASTGASMPMPATGGTTRRWIAIPWDNRWVPTGGHKETVLFQDIDDSTNEAVHTQIGTFPAGREPGTSANAPRWRVPTGRVTRQEVFYGRWDPTLTRIDTISQPFSDSGPGAEAIAIDTVTANDPYPFAFGHKYLLSGENNLEDGALHVYADGSYNSVVATIPYDPTQSSFPPPPVGHPMGTQSFQTFVWNSHLYAAYQVSDKNNGPPGCGMPSCLATEIWVVRFDSSDPDNLFPDRQCRISAIVGDVVPPPPEPYRLLSLFDPEPIVVQSGAIVYYTRVDVDTNFAELWRIRLGDEAQFAAACADPASLEIVEDPPK